MHLEWLVSKYFAGVDTEEIDAHPTDFLEEAAGDYLERDKHPYRLDGARDYPNTAFRSASTSIHLPEGAFPCRLVHHHHLSQSSSSCSSSASRFLYLLVYGKFFCGTVSHWRNNLFLAHRGVLCVVLSFCTGRGVAGLSVQRVSNAND